MTRSLTGLHVDRLIVHGVPKTLALERRKAGGAVDLQLSDIPTPLDATSRAFVQERILDSLRSHVRPVIEEPEIHSPVPALIKSYLGAPPGCDLVEPSRQLAIALDGAQAATSAPSGLLMVMDVKIGNDRGVVLAKAEAQRGARAGYQQIDGQWTFQVEYLKDLVFSQHSRVFKVGMFFTADAEGTLLTGEAVDRQKEGYGVSDYWLTTYLGCRFVQAPEVVTERFFETVTSWINDDVEDPADKAAYDAALLTEMRSTKREVQPSNFIATHIGNVNARESLRRRLRDANVATTSFTKSIVTIANRLRRVRIETAGGVNIDAPPDRIDDGTVAVTLHDDGERARVVVVDSLRKVDGVGAFRAGPEPRDVGAPADGR